MRNLRQLFLLDPILRWFRILRCNQQAALHSAMFNYTPLVIGGADKNKQLTNIKPTQTGIYRNKGTFWIIKSSEPLEKFKNQLHPLDRPGSVNFCKNYWNLSHETVPLSTRLQCLCNFRHKIGQPPHTWGVQKQSSLNCVDNSPIGRQVLVRNLPLTHRNRGTDFFFSGVLKGAQAWDIRLQV